MGGERSPLIFLPTLKGDPTRKIINSFLRELMSLDKTNVYIYSN